MGKFNQGRKTTAPTTSALQGARNTRATPSTQAPAEAQARQAGASLPSAVKGTDAAQQQRWSQGAGNLANQIGAQPFQPDPAAVQAAAARRAQITGELQGAVQGMLTAGDRPLEVGGGVRPTNAGTQMASLPGDTAGLGPIPQERKSVVGQPMMGRHLADENALTPLGGAAVGFAVPDREPGTRNANHEIGARGGIDARLARMTPDQQDRYLGALEERQASRDYAQEMLTATAGQRAWGRRGDVNVGIRGNMNRYGGISNVTAPTYGPGMGLAQAVGNVQFGRDMMANGGGVGGGFNPLLDPGIRRAAMNNPALLSSILGNMSAGQRAKAVNDLERSRIENQNEQFGTQTGLAREIHGDRMNQQGLDRTSREAGELAERTSREGLAESAMKSNETIASNREAGMSDRLEQQIAAAAAEGVANRENRTATQTQADAALLAREQSAQAARADLLDTTGAQAMALADAEQNIAAQRYMDDVKRDERDFNFRTGQQDFENWGTETSNYYTMNSSRIAELQGKIQDPGALPSESDAARAELQEIMQGAPQRPGSEAKPPAAKPGLTEAVTGEDTGWSPEKAPLADVTREIESLEPMMSEFAGMDTGDMNKDDIATMFSDKISSGAPLNARDLRDIYRYAEMKFRTGNANWNPNTDIMKAAKEGDVKGLEAAVKKHQSMQPSAPWSQAFFPNRGKMSRALTEGKRFLNGVAEGGF